MLRCRAWLVDWIQRDHGDTAAHTDLPRAVSLTTQAAGSAERVTAVVFFVCLALLVSALFCAVIVAPTRQGRRGALGVGCLAIATGTLRQLIHRQWTVARARREG